MHSSPFVTGRIIDPIRWIAAAVAGLILALPCPQLLGSSGPENVVVVVNANSQDSLALANHFIHLRDIPPQNVIYIDVDRDGEQVQLNYFRNRILKPVLETIEERKLADHIHYIVYSSDFPTAIDVQPHKKILNQRVVENRALYKPTASINSLTYFYKAVLANDPSYMLLDANWYMRQPVDGMFKNPFLGETQELYQDALDSYATGDYTEAIEGLTDLARSHPMQMAVLYNLARALARDGRDNEAVATLINATRRGWCYRSYTRDDPAFESLSEHVLFTELLKNMPDEPFEFLPTRGFRFNIAWGQNGWPNQSLDQAKAFMLSTVLGVTRNRGTSLEEAMDCLTRSAAADSSFPDGTFYFCQSNDVRTKTRQGQFAATIEELRQLGYPSQIVRGTIPKLKKDILGVSMGTPNYRWLKSGSRILPGAICENLTSYGGVMRTKNASQTTLAECIRSGASGSSGAVVEPFAIEQKFPHTRIHVHYARGCTLAESFYQSVYGPYQLLIVGDPLCKPFAEVATFSTEGIDDGDTVSGEVGLSIEADPDSIGVSRFEIYLDGKILAIKTGPEKETLKIDTSKYSDGYHEIRVAAIDATPIQTTTSSRIGFVVDNQGQKIEINSESAQIGIGDAITVDCKSNVGEGIQLVHNGRVIAELRGNSSRVDIPAVKFGVGHIRLFAQVLQKDKIIQSSPLEFVVK